MESRTYSRGHSGDLAIGAVTCRSSDRTIDVVGCGNFRNGQKMIGF